MLCTLCPRNCKTDRTKTPGCCGASASLKVARAAPHFWEEPCLSGKNGSGTVFFSGCGLHCVYCQNREISDGRSGKYISTDRLVEIFFELKSKSVHNINLVTPDPYLPAVAEAIGKAKEQGFDLPFVMNCSGYEKREAIAMMDGLIDIYLPDFKYASPILAKKYSAAPDYPEVAKAALAEMVRQQPKLVYDTCGMLQKGVLVRHLLLPTHLSDSKKVLAYLYNTYGTSIRVSIMSQYTPFGMDAFPELNRKVTVSEYDELTDFAWKLGYRDCFVQDGEAASESFIPAFDCEGV